MSLTRYGGTGSPIRRCATQSAFFAKNSGNRGNAINAGPATRKRIS
jgi:hypothetical protein